MIRFGTNPIAWSNDDDHSLGGDIPLQTCLREAGEIGFDGIEDGHKFPWDADVLRAALQPNGLAFVSAWYSLELLRRSAQAEIEAIQPNLDRLKAMGSTVCIACETSNSVHGDNDVPLDRRPVLDGDDAWSEFGEKVETVARHCEAEGLPLVYHPHMGTIVQTPDEYDRFMAVTGSATRLLFDTGHSFFGGADDPAAVLARHVDRVAHFHAKNVRADVMREVRDNRLSFLEGVRRGVFTVPGDPEGAIDFEPCLKLLNGAGYDGWLVIEAEQDPEVRNPLKYQTMGLSTLRSVAASAGFTGSMAGEDA